MGAAYEVPIIGIADVELRSGLSVEGCVGRTPAPYPLIPAPYPPIIDIAERLSAT